MAGHSAGRVTSPIQLKQANIQKIKDAKAERIKECDRRDLAIQEKQDEI